MDPRDRVRPLPDGAVCTACGAPVPDGGIRILARRDDLAFVELACAACGSTAIGLLLDAGAPDGRPILDVGDDAASGGSAPNGTFRPISTTDVEAVRRDLAAWDGDLVGWLDSIERADRGRSVVDR